MPNAPDIVEWARDLVRELDSLDEKPLLPMHVLPSAEGFNRIADRMACMKRFRAIVGVAEPTARPVKSLASFQDD
jgi:hypothetical protein